MGFFQSLANLFTKSGRYDQQLLAAMEHAKAGRAQKAIELYTALVDDDSVNDAVRARALFNRALAHSKLDHDDQAIKDLQDVLAMPNVPENVQTAARAQLVRVKKRAER